MIRTLAKSLPHPLLMRLHQRYQLAQQSSLARAFARRSGLPLLETLDLAPLKTSDTMFVLGSGPSINQIPDARWQVIGRHDTIAMNFWVVHPFVPRLYIFENLARTPGCEVIFDALQMLFERRALDYRNTVKIGTELASEGRQTLLEIPQDFRPHCYIGHSANIVARDEKELVAGLRYMLRRGMFAQAGHMPWLFKVAGSVLASLSIAVRMGYRRIILCGIDLKNAEYFYQDPERYPEAARWEFAPRNSLHPAAKRLKWLVPGQRVIAHFKREILDPAGIELFVENRSSALFPEIAELPPRVLDQLANGAFAS
jgi:hypothetical protein